MRTRNFTEDEFRCRCGRCAWSVGREGIVSAELMTALQSVRDAYGGPVRVTSGRRCPSHNYRVGGVSNSYHTRGLAADIVADDMLRLAAVCEAEGRLSYVELHDGYIHVDVGASRKSRVNDKRSVKPAA